MRTYRCRAALLAAMGLALAGLIALAGDAGAFQKGKKTNPNPKKTPNTPLTNPQLVQALMDARNLVHLANHDYKGYRGKAAQQIRDAIHNLDPKHKHPTLPAIKGGKEPQAESDMQLQQALLILQGLEPALASTPGTQTARAHTHVVNAIKDLQAALMIR